MRLYDPNTLERVEVDIIDVGEHLEKGLVPSVTEILSIIYEGEHLTKWFIKQSVHFYEQTGDLNGAIDYRNSQSADFGSICHALAEEYITGKPCEEEYSALHMKTVGPFKKWADNNIKEVVFAEKFFANGKLGYGGTADMLIDLKDGRRVLADLKFKKNSSKFPMKPSTSYIYQLCAYRNHFREEYGDMEIMNLLCASPFGTSKKPVLNTFLYHEDFTDGFEAAKKLWWHKYSSKTCPQVDEIIY